MRAISTGNIYIYNNLIFKHISGMKSLFTLLFSALWLWGWVSEKITFLLYQLTSSVTRRTWRERDFGSRKKRRDFLLPIYYCPHHHSPKDGTSPRQQTGVFDIQNEPQHGLSGFPQKLEPPQQLYPQLPSALLSSWVSISQARQRPLLWSLSTGFVWLLPQASRFW